MAWNISENFSIKIWTFLWILMSVFRDFFYIGKNTNQNNTTKIDVYFSDKFIILILLNVLTCINYNIIGTNFTYRFSMCYFCFIFTFGHEWWVYRHGMIKLNVTVEDVLTVDTKTQINWKGISIKPIVFIYSKHLSDLFCVKTMTSYILYNS